MKTWKTLGAMVGILVGVALGYLPCSTAEEGTNIEQRITQAQTPADHEALAAYYDKEAQAAHQKQAEYLQFSKSYSTLPTLQTKTGAVAHCNTIAKGYEELAEEYEALAKIHRDMAKSTQ